jgi:hypothetical protein
MLVQTTVEYFRHKKIIEKVARENDWWRYVFHSFT